MTVYAEVGGSLQQIGGSCPEGWVVMQDHRPTPTHIASADGRWTIDYAPRIAERRYLSEVSGMVVNGLKVNTDDRSKLLINGAALEATIDPNYTMQWKMEDGFVQLTGEQVISIARAVRAHVQACFDREAELLAALQDGALSDEMIEQGWPQWITAHSFLKGGGASLVIGLIMFLGVRIFGSFFFKKQEGL